jgi:4-oxalocrotonate tautomerase
MPKLDLTLNTQLPEEVVRKIVTELTSLTQVLLGKDPKITRIHINQNRNQCFVNSVYVSESSVFDLALYITKGTNTEEQKAQWLLATYQFLSEILGEQGSQQPNYISIFELDAHNWGYNGLNQYTRNY